MTDEQQTLETPEQLVAPTRPRRLHITRRVWLLALVLSLAVIVVLALVTVYGHQSGEPLLTLLGHGDRVLAVAYSPDGETIASGGADARVRLWNAATGQQMAQLKHTGPVHWVAYSPSGKLLAAVDSDRTVKLWEMPEGTLRATLRHREQPRLVAFSPDGTRLVTQAARSGALSLFDVESAGAIHLSDPREAVGWLVPQAREANVAARPGDGRQILITRGVEGEQLHKLAGHTDKLNWLTFSPDGRLLASAGGYTFETYTYRRGEVRLWDVAEGKLLTSVDWQRGAVTCVAFSPDGHRLAASNYDGTVCVWNVDDLLNSARLDSNGE